MGHLKIHQNALITVFSCLVNKFCVQILPTCHIFFNGLPAMLTCFLWNKTLTWKFVKFEIDTMHLGKQTTEIPISWTHKFLALYIYLASVLEYSFHYTELLGRLYRTQRKMKKWEFAVKVFAYKFYFSGTHLSLKLLETWWFFIQPIFKAFTSSHLSSLATLKFRI